MQPKALQLPPGPPPANTIFSALQAMRRFNDDAIGLFRHNFQTYGDIHRFEIMKSAQYQIIHPDHIHQVLVTDAHKFAKDDFYTDPERGMARFMGTGLVTSNGDFWRRQRKLMQPAFHYQRIVSYAAIMVERTAALIERWNAETASGGALIDVSPPMMRLTLDIVVDALFGADMSGDADHVFESVNVVQEFTSTISVLPTWIPTPMELRVRRALRDLDAVIYRLVAARRAVPGERHDLLAMLLEAETEDGERMTDRQIRDEIVTIFFAGHETTANAMNWTWYLLAQHPEAAAKLRAELDTVLEGRAPTLDDLKRLPYSEQVIKESMRLYPPVFGVSREALEDVEIGGYVVPKGASVGIMTHITHRDPRWWGSDAERFRPERWTPELEKTLPRYAYLPFGGGPRVCIGNSFAMMEAQIMLSMIASHFDLALRPGQRVETDAKITLRPKDGLPMRVAQRQPQPVPQPAR